MNFREVEAQIIQPHTQFNNQQNINSQNDMLTHPTQGYNDPLVGDQLMQQQQPGYGDMFVRQSDLRVIQEYNREENMPQEARGTFWALASKSIKLGFWSAEDYEQIMMHNNIIKIGHIMAKPKHKYTFYERQLMNQLDLLVYADFKRGIGMEKYKINERTLQATSVTQNIHGGAGGGGKQGGIMAGLKSFFG